jgi:hypothetical protein
MSAGPGRGRARIGYRAVRALGGKSGEEVGGWSFRMEIKHPRCPGLVDYFPVQSPQEAASRILQLQKRVKPDPEGWTVHDYINRDRP